MALIALSAFSLGALASSLIGSRKTAGRESAGCPPDSDHVSRVSGKDGAAADDECDDRPNGESMPYLPLHPIGKISSVYRLCVGTPRQGLLAPNSRGRVEISPSLLNSDSVLGLDGFSHLWVVFVFHLNTNRKIVSKSIEGAKSTKKGGARQFPSKIAPPALSGKKVGLFSTRTPHRPNPIGLTLCKIDSITINDADPGRPFCVNVSGLDLVDGTPVLDIKPFVPHYDTVINPEDTGCPTVIPDGVKVPHWVGNGLEKRRSVIFSDRATTELRNIVRCSQSQLEFYGPVSGRDTSVDEGLEAITNCIREVLAVDVRSKWQTRKARKGKFQAERAGRVKGVMGDPVKAGIREQEQNAPVGGKLCTQQLDNLLIKYSISAPDGSSGDAVPLGSGANDFVDVRSVQLLDSVATIPDCDSEGK